jgi:S1-C subfamily serine protease
MRHLHIFRNDEVGMITNGLVSPVKENEMSDSKIGSFSQELAAATERAGTSVVAVGARPRLPSSGIHWRKGVVVTAHHTVRREDDIHVLAPGGKRVVAKLAGRDPGTDLAILKLESEDGLAVPQFADATALYPGFSGGPLVNVEGKVVGVNTNGLGRGRAITVPVSTVNRTVDELLEKGHIARPYLGLAMQPVAIPESLRGKVKSSATSGLMVLHVEPSGPADKAGIVLGDVIVELQGKAALDTDNIQELLASAKIGDSISAGVLRAGTLLQIRVSLGERPARQ